VKIADATESCIMWAHTKKLHLSMCWSILMHESKYQEGPQSVRK